MLFVKVDIYFMSFSICSSHQKYKPKVSLPFLSGLQLPFSEATSVCVGLSESVCVCVDSVGSCMSECVCVLKACVSMCVFWKIV